MRTINIKDGRKEALSEKTLIKKCQRGEQSAFEELIRLYYDYVFGFRLKTAADKTAKTSADVINVLITDSENQLIYSAEKSEFAEKKIEFTKSGDDKKYLICAEHQSAVFKYVKADEFMLNSIINKDFGKIRSDYEDDSVFESNLSSKTVYMLNTVKAGGSDSRRYNSFVIRQKTNKKYRSLFFVTANGR